MIQSLQTCLSVPRQFNYFDISSFFHAQENPTKQNHVKRGKVWPFKMLLNVPLETPIRMQISFLSVPRKYLLQTWDSQIASQLYKDSCVPIKIIHGWTHKKTGINYYAIDHTVYSKGILHPWASCSMRITPWKYILLLTLYSVCMIKFPFSDGNYLCYLKYNKNVALVLFEV